MVIFLLASAFFVAVSVNYVISPVLPVIARTFGISISAAGSLVAIYSICYAFSALALGPTSDHFGRKPMIVSALVVFAAMTVLCGVVRGFALLLVCRALAGVAAATMQPATWSYLGDFFPYERRGKAAGWVMQAGSLALIGGVPLGSIVAQFLGWRWIFIGAGLLGIAVAFVLMVRLPPLWSRDASDDGRLDLRGLIQEGRQAFGSLVSTSRARSALVVSFLVWFGFFGLYTYIGAFLEERLDLNTARVGLVTLTVGIGYVLGGQMGGRLSDRLGRKTVILAGLIWLAIVLAAIPQVRALPVAVAGILTMGFGFFFTYTAQVTLMTELLPEARGTTMSVNYFVTYVGVTAGSAIGGFVLARSGYALVGAVSAAACIMALFVAARFVFAEDRHEDYGGQCNSATRDGETVSASSKR
jgi:predicted MFS family arabinose efflux permease